METNNHISDLLIKYLKDELSMDEQAMLQAWVDKDERNRTLFEDLTDESKVNEKLGKFNSIEKDTIWSKTLEKMRSEGYDDVIIPNKRFIPWYRIAAIASVLIFVSFFAYRSLKTPSTVQVVEQQEQEDISPGGNKATLTLSDGTIVSLDEVDKGEITEIEGMKISKTADGQVVYEAASAGSQLLPEEKVRYNQIATPRGGQYQIILPDSTKVWLNAGSSLNYPVRFAGDIREVTLTGEAYFEVNKRRSATHQKVPFIVRTSTQTVEVLGTHFNINAYENEGTVKTTLVEGSVRVSVNLHNGKIDRNNTVLLKPHQQSILNADHLNVIPVDIESAVAWKDGYYKFNSEALGSIMRKISRWYDVEVEFQENTAEYRFGGKISRKENISKVLEIMKETGNVHFEIEGSFIDGGKKIVVMPVLEQAIEKDR